MADFTASALAPAFWKLAAYPGHPVVIERIAPDGPFQSAKYEVDSEAEIVPSIESIGCGLFKVTSHYKVASGDVREKQSYYLVAGRFSLVHLSDALGASIEGAIS
jgi:hypothetical protein